MLCRSLNIKYIGLPKKYRELNYILLILTEGTNSYLNDNQNNEKFGYWITWCHFHNNLARQIIYSYWVTLSLFKKFLMFDLMYIFKCNQNDFFISFLHQNSRIKYRDALLSGFPVTIPILSHVRCPLLFLKRKHLWAMFFWPTLLTCEC